MVTPTAAAPVEREDTVDSGASVDLIARKNLTAEEWNRRVKLKCPLILRTANHKITVKYCTDVFVPAMEKVLKFYILDDSQSVLSLGVLTS